MNNDDPKNPPGPKRSAPQRTMIAPLPGRGGPSPSAPNPIPNTGSPAGRNAWSTPTGGADTWGGGQGTGAAGGGSAFGPGPGPGFGAPGLGAPGLGAPGGGMPGGEGARPLPGTPANFGASGTPAQPSGTTPWPAAGADPWGGGSGGSSGGGTFAPTPAGMAHPSQASGGGGGHAWMGSTGGERFFPDLSRPSQQGPTPQAQRIPLEQALGGASTGYGAGTNPLKAAAASLLILLGRLRSQVVEMQAIPLMTHVAQELEGYERRAIEGGADAQDALVAKYVLCGTADDIVQNLPGTDREIWIQYSMEARFFNRRTSGVGVFEEIDKALMDAHRRYHLLELMLISLYQGFEGRFRGVPGGDVDLQQKRRQIYETLRHVRARADDDISPHWQGVSARPLYQRRKVPLWVVASLVLALLSGGYLGMRMYLADVSGSLSTQMRSLHPQQTLALLRMSVLPDLPPDPEPYVPPVFAAPGQLDRIRDALQAEIAAGTLSAEMRGNFIAVTANNIVLFDSGRAEARADFAPIAARIAAVLEAEAGAIHIVGHTDSVPLSGRGRFRSNQELSVARAQSVADLILTALSDPTRVEVAGRGEDDPIADNATPDGRAENRRVEILIQRDDA